MISKEMVFNYVYKELGIKNIDEASLNKLFELFAYETNFEFAKKQIDVLYSLNRILIGTYNRVSVDNMMKILNDIDDNLIGALFSLYVKIESRGLKGIDLLKEFKIASYEILKNNKKVNLKIRGDLYHKFEELTNVKHALYSSMDDLDKADKLLQNCISRAKKFLSECDSKNLYLTIKYLKECFDFNDDELVDISSKCATFFAFSSANKIKQVHEVTSEFKKFIKEFLNLDNAQYKIYSLLDRDTKEILSNSASIAIGNMNNLANTLRFFKGETLGEISTFADEKIRNIKGNFTSLQLAKIYHNSITSLSIGTDKIADVCYNLNQVYIKYYNRELDYTKIINGHNFTDLEQLTKKDYLCEGKIDQIFKVLTEFFTQEEFEKLLQNDLSFLVADTNDVIKGIKDAILNSSDEEQIKKNIARKIKNHFDIYQVNFDNVNKNMSIGIDKAQKVKVKDLDKENIMKFLLNINTSEEEIEKWLNSWNNENEELRDLELQIYLYDMSNQIYDLELMLPKEYIDIEKFKDESIEVASLLLELEKGYEEKIKNIRLKDEIKEKSNFVYEQISNLKNKINENYLILESLYSQQLIQISDQLTNKNVILSSYNLKKEEVVSLEEKLSRIYKGENTFDEDKRKLEEIIKYKRKMEKIKNMLVKSDIDSAKVLDKFSKDIVMNKIRIGKTSTPIDTHRLIYLMSYVLEKEGLLCEGFCDKLDKDVVSIDELTLIEKNMSFSELLSLMPLSSRKIAIEYRNMLVKEFDLRIKLTDTLVELSQVLNIDFDSYNRRLKYVDVLKIVDEETKEISNRYSAASIICGKKTFIETQMKKIDIEICKKEIANLISQMTKIDSIVKEINKKKLNVI